ncbi:MAG TPA: LysR family transcriptional regulator [Paracoccaceae bacterium]|nr:LysR family transcriptional regulator [Paracoccaceae bacterium]
MDIRRLHAFVKIVDIGSITRAATILRIAQPALSQQIVALETHFGKPLLVRSKRGVVPTEAGKLLYRHGLQILRQLEQAELDINRASEALTGFVTVGLAPLGLGSQIGARLITTVRQRFPGINLHVNETVGGGVISEMIMTGKMDAALIFDPGGIPGLAMEQVTVEELYHVTLQDAAEEITLAEVVERDLVLPGRIHTIRQVIDTTLARASRSANVVAQTESISLMVGALDAGLGDTILPLSAARAVQARLPAARIARIRKPNMKITTSICVSATLPPSEPAVAVRAELLRLARDYLKTH